MLNGKILIIDDDTDILQVVRMILRKNGFKAVTFSSPPSNFVEEVMAINPTVIILDVQLGGYDGRELGKQIKEVKQLAHIPVILFSANNHFKDDATAYLCDDFIEKPFAVDFFIDKIKYYAQKEFLKDFG
jgi:DNA-binding response OmpR family regulator